MLRVNWMQMEDRIESAKKALNCNKLVPQSENGEIAPYNWGCAHNPKPAELESNLDEWHECMGQRWVVRPISLSNYNSV